MVGGLFPTPLEIQDSFHTFRGFVDSWMGRMGRTKSEVLHFCPVDLERHQHFLGTDHRGFDSAVVRGHQETI